MLSNLKQSYGIAANNLNLKVNFLHEIRPVLMKLFYLVVVFFDNFHQLLMREDLI